jgi:hypothetical protein
MWSIKLLVFDQYPICATESGMEVSASQHQRQHMQEIGRTYLSGSSVTDKDKLEGGD